MGLERVLGVDACKAGWIGVTLGDGAPRGYFGRDIGALVSWVGQDGDLVAVAIDIPIGLPDRGRRQADGLARAMIGRRSSSVFTTPVREALLAPDHARAVAINRKRTGEGISAQAFGLRTKLLQVDAWVQLTSQRVIEVHPKVSFARLAGNPLTTRKSTWAGTIGVNCPQALMTYSMLPSPHGPHVATYTGRRSHCPTRRRPSATRFRARSGCDLFPYEGRAGSMRLGRTLPT